MKTLDLSRQVAALDAASARLNPILMLVAFGLFLLCMIAATDLHSVPVPAAATAPHADTAPRADRETTAELLKDMANHD